MALFKGILGQISGKIGGNIFSHGRSGSIIKAWKKPTNPNSVSQQQVRSRMSFLAARWNDIVTADQRLAWTIYGKNVAMKNRMGDSIFLTGQQHYMRSNIPRLYGNHDVVDDGPTVFNLGELSHTTGVITKSNFIDVNFDDTAEWVDTDGAHLLIRASIGMNPTINFGANLLRRVRSINGDSGAPETSPMEIPTKFTYANGQRVFFESRLSQADGRLSAAILLPVTVDFP